MIGIKAFRSRFELFRVHKQLGRGHYPSFFRRVYPFKKILGRIWNSFRVGSLVILRILQNRFCIWQNERIMGSLSMSFSKSLQVYFPCKRISSNPCNSYEICMKNAESHQQPVQVIQSILFVSGQAKLNMKYHTFNLKNPVQNRF